MKTTNSYDDVIYDGEDKPYRYRRGVYPTLFSLARHPDRHKHGGLVGALWGEGGPLLVTMGFIGFAGYISITGYSLSGRLDGPSIGFVFFAALLSYTGYRRARSLMKYAAAIDLAAKTCPACGYPLTAEDNDDSPTNALCTECGRRWTVAERADVAN